MNTKPSSAKRARVLITGKPVGMGGSLGRTEATGYGVMYTVREASKLMNIKPENTTAAFPGIRKRITIRAPIIPDAWVETRSAFRAGIKRTRSRIPIAKCRASASTNSWASSIASAASTKRKAKDLGYEILPGDAWIEQDVDILVPAAIENQVTAETVQKISKKVRIVAEGANGPTTPEADKVLEDRGVFMIPDFLANAGGVTCSYFEQVQSNMNYFWEKDEVLGKLDIKMTSAFSDVSDLAKKKKLYMRDAAYMIAVSRVAQACRDRGWV